MKAVYPPAQVAHDSSSSYCASPPATRWTKPATRVALGPAVTTAEPTLKHPKSPVCSETSKGMLTSPTGPKDPHVEADVSASMARECHSEERVMLLPGHAGELPQLGDRCDCAPEWRCDPHDTCFIHDSCFCDGSGSWPPVKPIRSYLRHFSSDWKAAMKSPSHPLPFP